MTTRSPLIPPTPSAEEYLDEAGRPLDDVFKRTDPVTLFADWLADATETEANDPNAVAFATSDSDGLPDVRILLLKDFGEAGFTVFSHRDGTKGKQLSANPQAAMAFHWKTQRRQVRLRGRVETIADADADAYFATRARLSQIGAHASEQSRPLASRDSLRDAVARLDSEMGETIPRPADWTGFRLVPDTIEFWRDRPFRLHDRLLFTRTDKGWTTQRLYP